MRRGRPRNPEPKPKPDRRKIPMIFRAAEKDSEKIFYGVLISEDGFNLTAFACHNENESHLKERTLEKKDFIFSKASKDDLEINAKIALHRMRREVDEQQMEFDAAKDKYDYTKNKLNEVLEEVRNG